MASAKDIQIKLIDSASARAFVKRWHYSGKVVSNSILHFGCFLNGVLGGVMQFGSPMDKSKILPLFTPAIPWGGVLELNRMAFSNILPKNSESRCIAYAIRFIRKKYPHMKAIVSFADGTQCGDGTIYRASGFLLTKIGANKQIYKNEKTGEKLTKIVMTTSPYHGVKYRTVSEFLRANPDFHKIPGFMLRYIKILDPNIKLTCKILPYSDIIKAGAQMYLGKKPSVDGVAIARPDSIGQAAV